MLETPARVALDLIHMGIAYKKASYVMLKTYFASILCDVDQSEFFGK